VVYDVNVPSGKLRQLVDPTQQELAIGRDGVQAHQRGLVQDLRNGRDQGRVLELHPRRKDLLDLGLHGILDVKVGGLAVGVAAGGHVNRKDQRRHDRHTCEENVLGLAEARLYKVGNAFHIYHILLARDFRQPHHGHCDFHDSKPPRVCARREDLGGFLDRRTEDAQDVVWVDDSPHAIDGRTRLRRLARTLQRARPTHLAVHV